MARRVYTDTDKARVLAVLETNQGNVKRTARETGVPVMTVRDWKAKWEKEGLPAEVSEALPEARAELVDTLNRISNKALHRLEDTLDDPTSKASVKDLATTAAILIDKARLVDGKATSRTESLESGSLPVEHVREMFAGFARGIVDAARERDAAISSATDEEEPIDVEYEEQAPLALPAGV